MDGSAKAYDNKVTLERINGDLKEVKGKLTKIKSPKEITLPEENQKKVFKKRYSKNLITLFKVQMKLKAAAKRLEAART